MLVFTVCATSPLVAHPALLPVPARQSNAKMKDPGPAVVSIVIGDPEVKLVGTANTSSVNFVGVPNPFSVSSV
jgi:hypothetical protein